MPTIAFVSPKGGAGKTTSAFLLSVELAKLYDVTIIDADPNHPVQTWAMGGHAPPRLSIMSDADEDTIIERIEDAAEKTPFVVVDLEGRRIEQRKLETSGFLFPRQTSGAEYASEEELRKAGLI